MKKYKNLLIILLLFIICTPLIVFAVDNTLVHDIQIDKRGGSGGANKITASSAVNGKKMYLPERIAVPSKSGVSFSGYYSSDGKTKYYDSEGKRTYDKEVTTSLKKVYAQWTNGTKIYFVKNNDACTTAKNSGKCEESKGCFLTIDGQGYNKVMNRKSVPIPDLGSEYAFRGYRADIKTNDGKSIKADF